MFSNFLSRIRTFHDVDLLTNEMTKVFVRQLNNKQRLLGENLYAYFKDQIENLYE